LAVTGASKEYVGKLAEPWRETFPQQADRMQPRLPNCNPRCDIDVLNSGVKVRLDIHLLAKIAGQAGLLGVKALLMCNGTRRFCHSGEFCCIIIQMEGE